MLFHKLRDGMACGTKPYTLMTDMLMYPLLELQLSILLLSEYKQTKHKASNMILNVP